MRSDSMYLILFFYNCPATDNFIFYFIQKIHCDISTSGGKICPIIEPPAGI
jgi:hypothetical protein